ncbi:hypothetical protein HHI36_000291 [Cryptolaemus montrouzieri]|uniref:Uncharacterized protein n=1 Tax=Cryptolaemus montrouzieri TaxID=559131 RepID=A0ABD2P4J7_9CUCU
MYLKVGVFLAFGVFVMINSALSLKCVDSNSKDGVTICANGDVCFRHEENNTKKVTVGCSLPRICDNVNSGQDNCTTCSTDLCNSGCDSHFFSYTIFSTLFLFILAIFVK